MTSIQELQKFALDYANINWHVFPCAVDQKTPACSNGFKNATTDQEQINQWWKNTPYNIGIATGASGLVVVDFDLVEGVAVGETNFKALPEYEPLPETFTVKTRSGGKQYYFRANGTGIKSSNSQLCKNVDIKALGGYVIAPPSYVKADSKASGGQYIIRKFDEPAPLPIWLESMLLELQRPKNHSQINTDSRCESLNDFPYCEVNIEKLCRAVKNRFQLKDFSTQDEWIKLLFEFRSLIYLVGWSDDQAWSLFDKVCQWEKMGNYNYDNNRARWEVDDFRLDGRTYKSLLAELSKFESVPKALGIDQSFYIPSKNELFSLSMFSLRGQVEVMRKKMLDDVFVLAYIALLGQATTIYARANTGKTLLVLWMLIQSIIAERIKGENVIYINADDTYAGFIQKLELAEKHGFHMLMPNQNGFDPQAMQGYLRQMIDHDTARNSIIVLDTLKKFTDLMDKKAGSGFMSRVREFIAAGGTVISLAHTNKNKNGEGKSVFCGTSDVVDDCDCVYILDTVNTTDSLKVVLFENIKNRGNVAKELAVSYSVVQGNTYQQMFDSVKVGNENEALQAKVEIAANAELNNDKEAIQAITEALEAEQGLCAKTELLKLAQGFSDVSRRLLIKTLEKYTGSLWTQSTGDKNLRSYQLINKQSLALNNILKKWE
jgi:archaellum biogenesis ATPase FlaH